MMVDEADEEDVERSWKKLVSWYEDNDIHEGVVAFSGGKDSTLVLDSAIEAMDEVRAVIFVSEFMAEPEISYAVEKAKGMDVGYEVIEVSVLDDDRIAENPDNRCYFCKLKMFEELKDENNILEGTNRSDLSRHRPGYQAVKELARSPLLESGIGEEEVRKILRWRGHDNWNRASGSCLATRVPTGETIDQERLKRIESAEKRLSEFGFKQLRVRDHNKKAVIEVVPDEIDKLVENRENIIERLKDEGYEKIYVDLMGYKTGSLIDSR